MNQELVSFAIDLARKRGCEYAEARYQRTNDLGCLVRNGIPEPAEMVEAEGLGVRVVYDGALAFGATNQTTNENVSDLVENLVRDANAASEILKDKIHFSNEESQTENWGCEEKKKIEDVSVESMISLLRDVDKTLTQPISDVSFPNRMFFVGYSVEEKLYANSDGSRLESRVPRASFASILTALYGGKPTTASVPPGFSSMGGTGGWETIEQLDLTNYVPQGAKEITNGIKAFEKPPTGETLDVILGPNVAGLTSHESCGHPGEADRILGREGAQAGESFLKPDTLGMQIGSPEAYVSDDPTIPHSMGFYLFDDEGVKARKRELITAGKFTEFLQNRSTAYYFGIKSNGSSRAVQFDREPIIRMGNTYIEPGDWTLDEMLKDVKRGVYIKSFMEWNIDDKRLNQRYVGLEAYLVENGALKNPVKDPVFEITTPRYWGSIDARGKDLQFTCGTCGKGDPMQGAPVFFGAPHIRLRNVSVGSR
ncbi:MAG: TldD/PmbA family protein [Nitrososphaerales archaeon]